MNEENNYNSEPNIEPLENDNLKSINNENNQRVNVVGPKVVVKTIKTQTMSQYPTFQNNNNLENNSELIEKTAEQKKEDKEKKVKDIIMYIIMIIIIIIIILLLLKFCGDSSGKSILRPGNSQTSSTTTSSTKVVTVPTENNNTTESVVTEPTSRPTNPSITGIPNINPTRKTSTTRSTQQTKPTSPSTNPTNPTTPIEENVYTYAKEIDGQTGQLKVYIYKNGKHYILTESSVLFSKNNPYLTNSAAGATNFVVIDENRKSPFIRCENVYIRSTTLNDVIVKPAPGCN